MCNRTHFCIVICCQFFICYLACCFVLYSYSIILFCYFGFILFPVHSVVLFHLIIQLLSDSFALILEMCSRYFDPQYINHLASQETSYHKTCACFCLTIESESLLQS
jgi:hypothetical protein